MNDLCAKRNQNFQNWCPKFYQDSKIRKKELAQNSKLQSVKAKISITLLICTKALNFFDLCLFPLLRSAFRTSRTSAMELFAKIASKNR